MTEQLLARGDRVAGDRPRPRRMSLRIREAGPATLWFATAESRSG
ncbi:MAG: hypothetical protein WDN49_14545 [Acetobacteraceae bacterium]